jgi:hypothetical protein
MSLNTQYMDMIWLKFYGLSKVNVLDYFYSSPFFDISSNNQLIRTQGVTPDHLLSMVGLEYVLDQVNISEPNLYVIKMQFRKSLRETSPRDIFYCIDGIIYKSPDMLDLVRSRIAKASHYLGNSFDELHQTISYSSTTGHRCWSSTSANGRELNDGSKLSMSSSDVGQVEKKKASTTVNIREFPNFSRLIDDLESSF